MKSKFEKSLLPRFIRYYKPHKGLFLLDMVCAFAIAGLDLLFPVFTEEILYGVGAGEEMKILLFAGILLGLYLIRSVADYIMAYWGHVVGVRMEFDMRADLYHHIQNLDVEYFDNNKTGQIMSRLTNDLRDITELAHHGPEDLFISIVMLIGTFIFLLQKNVLLTIVIYTLLIGMIFFTVKKRKGLLKAFKATRKKHADINAHLESSISGIRLCKSYANEPYEMEKFQDSNVAYRNSYYHAYREMAEYAAGNSFFLNIVSVVALILGGYLVIMNLADSQDIVVFILYTYLFVSPIRRLVSFTQQFQQGFAGFSRFAEIMDIQPKILDRPNAVPLSNPNGDIELVDVSFQYNPNSAWIFKDFNLKIHHGKTIALVGPTGVGKTTLSYLIPRFYEIQKGQVLLNGVDVRDLELDSIRSQIGFVQQDVVIFYGTIRENIIYGKPLATEEEIIEAAKKANIHTFIMGLPNKYDSLVGERGVKLSGGQKQRISLARVFLQNPPILILDEATSSLDNATELAIQESIERLAKNRTTLIVAHRLSTIKNADEIIVLTTEGIVERGTHEELLQRNGVYNQLYQSQFDGFIPETLPIQKT